MIEYQHIQPDENAAFKALMMHCLLFRLGGQQKFTMEEIVEIQQQHIGVRIIHNRDDQTFVLTLQPRAEPREVLIS